MLHFWGIAEMDLIACIILGVVCVRYGGRFMDWFEAERGAGPGRNGWV